MKETGFSKSEVERLLTFEGYGNKQAAYWFLGMEEGGGSIEQLRNRAQSFEPVEDLQSAVKKIGIDIKKYSPTWRVISTLTMAMLGRLGWRDKCSAIEYQVDSLGRAHGDTFPTELMPLPCPRINDWPYKSLFRTKAEYFSKIRPRRIKWLRSEISTIKPAFVICYGKGNWRHHQEIFSDVAFHAELNEEIRLGRLGHSTILLLPFLSPDLVKRPLIEEIAELLGQ